MTSQDKIVHAIQLALAIPVAVFVAACIALAIGY